MPPESERVHHRAGEVGARAGATRVAWQGKGTEAGAGGAGQPRLLLALLVIFVVGHDGVDEAAGGRARGRGGGVGGRGRLRRGRRKSGGGGVPQLPLLRADLQGQPALPPLRVAGAAAHCAAEEEATN